MMVADSGNGVSAHLDPARWLFVNVDLTVVLHRQPRGEWVLLDAVTTIGPDGAALAASRLSDRDGAVGQGMQTLVVTPR
jgi:acyl-CoA thioesterase